MSLAELLIDFVPRDAYLIFALLNKEWNRIWRQKKIPQVSSIVHFSHSANLVRYALANLCDINYLSIHLVEENKYDLFKHILSLDIENELRDFNPLRLHAGLIFDLDFVKWGHARGFKLFDSLFVIAARERNLEGIKWLYRNGCPQDYHLPKIISYADAETIELMIEHHKDFNPYFHWHIVERGDLEIIKLFHDLGKFSMNLAQIAANYNNLEIIKWAHANGYSLEKCRYKNPIIYNNFEMIEWMYKNGCPLTPEVYIAAMGAGNFQIIEWAHERRCPFDGAVYSASIMEGNLGFIEWFHEKGCPLPHRACSIAANGNHFDILKWLYLNGHPLDEETCKNAIRKRNLEMLRWARENGAPWSGDSFHVAAMYGDLEIIKYMHENGCPWNSSMYIIDTNDVSLEIVQWLREHGCPWDESACSDAAECGDLERLKWLRANGCPWDVSTLAGADEYDHIKVFEWAVNNGCPLPAQYVFSSLINRGRIDMIKILERNGHRYAIEQQHIIPAAERGHLPIIEWAVGNGYVPTREMCHAAFIRRRFHILHWIKGCGCVYHKMYDEIRGRARALETSNF